MNIYILKRKRDKRKPVSQRRMEFYKFDIQQEQNIYTYLCKGKLRIKVSKKMSDDIKFETYGQWKQYIWDKYHNFSDEKLEEFSRYLNQCSRDIKPVYECWKMFISICLALMFNTFFEFLISIGDFHFRSILEGVVIIGFVMIASGFFSYTIAKISMPLSDQEHERNFYLDYREIIDEMIEKRKENDAA